MLIICPECEKEASKDGNEGHCRYCQINFPLKKKEKKEEKRDDKRCDCGEVLLLIKGELYCLSCNTGFPVDGQLKPVFIARVPY